MKEENYAEANKIKGELGSLNKIKSNLNSCTRVAFEYPNGNTGFTIDIDKMQSKYENIPSGSDAEKLFAQQSLKLVTILKKHIDLMIAELERDFEAL